MQLINYKDLKTREDMAAHGASAILNADPYASTGVIFSQTAVNCFYTVGILVEFDSCFESSTIFRSEGW